MVTKFCMVMDVDLIARSLKLHHKRSKVTRGQGSKVKVSINVKEKAGGLMPMSSCFINVCLSFQCVFPILEGIRCIIEVIVWCAAVDRYVIYDETLNCLSNLINFSDMPSVFCLKVARF